MGLDTYATRRPEEADLTPDDLQAFADADLQLCGGMYSGDAGSFRGKVYDSVVRAATDYSLYQPWLTPEEVRVMADQMEACDAEAVAKEADVTVGEVRDLARFFRICADRGLGLYGWD